MKTLQRIGAISFLIIMLFVCACSSSKNLNRREQGDQAFERRDYPSAIEDYQIYLEDGLASEQTMHAHFMLARSYFENKDYPTAAVEFEIFQRDYPRSDSLVAAAFYVAQCWVEQSPDFDRDSAPTEQAIRQLENFLLDNPVSDYSARAEESILLLKDKLARKTIEIARLYSKMHRPDAAAIYYEKLLRYFRDSAYWEDGLIELLKTRLALGELDEADMLSRGISVEYPGSDLEKRARELMDNNRP